MLPCTLQSQPVLSTDDSALVRILPSENIRIDMRYATDNNVFGRKFYDEPKAWLTKPAATALFRAADSLKTLGFGILVYDAYRPWSVTKLLWDAVDSTRKKYVANPAKGSRHNRGCAVDVGLFHLDSGLTAEMPSAFDDFTERASILYQNCSEPAKKHREMLRNVMVWAGFKGITAEWWHFDADGWEQWPVLNVPIR
jgi:D-alanyl-D-alanine dipeptidase